VVEYKGQTVGRHRLDMLIEDVLVLECKVADSLLPIHTRQVVSYLKATDLRLGLLFNFKVNVLTKGGIKRVVR
jgi:GxxExxY protein